MTLAEIVHDVVPSADVWPAEEFVPVPRWHQLARVVVRVDGRTDEEVIVQGATAAELDVIASSARSWQADLDVTEDPAWWSVHVHQVA